MEQQSISFYDHTGRITSTVTSDPATVRFNRGKAAAPFVDGDHYGKDVFVKDGHVVARPKNPAALIGRKLVDVPVPSTIYINNKAYPCADSTVELGFDYPGKYLVRVEAWPFLDKEFTVENPA